MRSVRALSPALFVLAACASAGTSSRTSSSPAAPASTPAFVEPAFEGPCEGEYLSDVGVTGLAFHVEGAGNYTAAVVGDAWSFVCAPAGGALVRGEDRGGERSMGVQLEAAPEGDFEMTAYLTRYIEDANTRLVAAGFTIEAMHGPESLSDDAVGMVSVVRKDGRSAIQLVVMRGLRTSAGLLRYTAIAWRADERELEAAMDALFRASHALMPIE